MIRAIAAVFLCALGAFADGERPRVLVRAKAADGCPGLDEVAARANQAPWKDRVEDLRETTEGKALLWRLTGDEKAAQDCLAELKAMTGDDGYGLSGRGPIFSLPVAYDWLFDWKGFSAADRKGIASKIESVGDACQKFLSGPDDSVWHTSAPRALMGVALAGAALDGKKAEEFRAFAKKYFEETYAPAMAGLDGGAVAGMSYGLDEGFEPLCHALWAMKTGWGLDEFGFVKAHGDWLALRADYVAFQTVGDLTFQRWGDCVQGSRAGLRDEGRNVLDMLRRATGSKSAAWLSARVAEKWKGSRGYHSCVLPAGFVFGSGPDPGANEPAKCRLFGEKTIGQAFFRSGWTDRDAVVFFKAGDYFDDHGHFDQGSFTIWRGGWLALDGGAYGNFNADHRLKYLRMTVAHNTLLFGSDAGGGQRVVKGQDFQDLADWEKKKSTRSLDGGTVTSWQEGPGWACVEATLAAAYEPKVVAEFTRQLVWIDPGVIVICDRVKASVPARWLLHTAGEPKIDGAGFVVENDASRLTGLLLLPKNAKPSKVGPGCLVDGVDIPPDAKGEYGAPGAWRIEETGSDVFLNVLFALDKGAAAPAAKKVDDGAGGCGVDVAGLRILFPKSGKASIKSLSAK